jgi:hypothetical protein
MDLRMRPFSDPPAILFPVHFDSQVRILRRVHSPYWRWVQRSYAKALHGSPLPLTRA